MNTDKDFTIGKALWTRVEAIDGTVSFRHHEFVFLTVGREIACQCSEWRLFRSGYEFGLILRSRLARMVGEFPQDRCRGSWLSADDAVAGFQMWLAGSGRLSCARAYRPNKHLGQRSDRPDPSRRRGPFRDIGALRAARMATSRATPWFLVVDVPIAQAVYHDRDGAGGLRTADCGCARWRSIRPR